MLFAACVQDLWCFVFCFFLLLEAVDLTGSVATEPVRVGGVCLHFFLHGT